MVDSKRASITVRIADRRAFRLFMWEVKEVLKELSLEDHPQAVRLEQAIARFNERIGQTEEQDESEQAE